MDKVAHFPAPWWRRLFGPYVPYVPPVVRDRDGLADVLRRQREVEHRIHAIEAEGAVLRNGNGHGSVHS